MLSCSRKKLSCKNIINLTLNAIYLKKCMAAISREKSWYKSGSDGLNITAKMLPKRPLWSQTLHSAIPAIPEWFFQKWQIIETTLPFFIVSIVKQVRVLGKIIAFMLFCISLYSSRLFCPTRYQFMSGRWAPITWCITNFFNEHFISLNSINKIRDVSAMNMARFLWKHYHRRSYSSARPFSHWWFFSLVTSKL